MTGHTLTLTIDEDYLTATFRCHEPKGSECRLYCTSIDHEFYRLCDGEPLNVDPVTGLGSCPACERLAAGSPHCGVDGYPLRPCDCNIVTWLTESGTWEEQHHGPAQTLRGGPAPIEVTWDGDNYLWRYPDEVALDAPGDPGARMNAYYYGFDRTGVGIIDAILSAVATAGKRAHHTQNWADDDPWQGGSLVKPIQEAADAAARAIREHVATEVPS